MINNKNLQTLSSQERTELHRAIWSIADDLRGSVDGWDFKNYVLGIMFYRYISENIQSHFDSNEHKAGRTSFSYASLDDSKVPQTLISETVKSKGFFIYPSQLFCNVLKNAKGDEDLNITLGKVFEDIESTTKGTPSETNFNGLFDDIDLNSNRLGGSVVERNKRLIALLSGVGKMQLRCTNNIDAFGDAYEYLMSMYASNAGKSGGEFFTPQEVSQLLARITMIGRDQINKVYDPACGSGSLLLQFEKLLGKEKLGRGFFGQEINITTYNLCRINMFLHNIGYDKFDIANGDTLLDPRHDDFVPFEAIVSNPPYSIKWEGDTNPVLIDDARYSPAGVLAPKSKADMAFIMHSLSYLASSGTAAIVCFPGIFYRGGAEQKIRQYLIEKNFVDTVIALPPNLFYGTSIATNILVLKKSRKDNKVLFIDASSEFIKVANNNKLEDKNIEKVIGTITDRVAIPYYAHLASMDDIKQQEYNLSVSTYVQKEDTREQVDITKLNVEIAEIVARQSKLRTEIDAIVADLEGKK
ncbi:MAG: type I restriction-modification system subunit M [Firmicutes bacterium]|nr:type I restriction-modification system subunit M [Bacillota bacterium]